MDLAVDGRRAFCYTASHAFDPGKPTLVFVHGAGLEHSAFGLQSRYFGYHGRNVLALDLPGHGRSEGPPLSDIAGMADWVSTVLEVLRIPKAAVVGHSACLRPAANPSAARMASFECRFFPWH